MDGSAALFGLRPFARIGAAAAAETGAETRQIRLNELKFTACEGYYSKGARACTWPCSITRDGCSEEMKTGL